MFFKPTKQKLEAEEILFFLGKNSVEKGKRRFNFTKRP